MATSSSPDQEQSTTTASFFEAIQAAMADSLKTLCQDQTRIGSYSPAEAPGPALDAVAGQVTATISASVRDHPEQRATIFIPSDSALALTGLSLYMDAEEIAAMQARDTPGEDDLDGLSSLADQLLSALATAVRDALGGSFAFEGAAVESALLTAEGAASRLPDPCVAATFPLAIESYGESDILFAMPGTVLDALVPLPADAAGPKPSAPDAGYAPKPAQPEANVELDSALRRLLKIPVPVIVLLAETKATTEEVLEITEGTVIQFEKGDEEWLDLLANNKKIGCGKVVKVGKKLGLRIEKIGDAKEILKNL